MSNQETQLNIPNPKATKVLTLPQWCDIMALYYNGSLSSRTTTQAYYSALAGESIPSCVSNAIRTWKLPTALIQQKELVRKNQAKAEAKVINAIGAGEITTESIVAHTDLPMSSINVILRRLIAAQKLERMRHKDGCYRYSLPAKGVAA